MASKHRLSFLLVIPIPVAIGLLLAAPWADGEIYDAEDALTKLTLSAEIDFRTYLPYQPIILTAKLANPNRFDVKVKSFPFLTVGDNATLVEIFYPGKEEPEFICSGCDERREYTIKAGESKVLKININNHLSFMRMDGRRRVKDYAKGEYRLRITAQDFDKDHKLVKELSFEITEPQNPLDAAALKRYKEIASETLELGQDNLWRDRGPRSMDSYDFAFFSKLIEFYEQFGLSTYGVYVAHNLGRTYRAGIYRRDENGKSTEKTQSFEIAAWYLQNVVDNRNEYSYRYEAMHDLAVCYRYTGRLEDAILLDEEVYANADDPALVKDAKKTLGWYRERQKSLLEKAEKDAAEAAEADDDE